MGDIGVRLLSFRLRRPPPTHTTPPSLPTISCAFQVDFGSAIRKLPPPQKNRCPVPFQAAAGHDGQAVAALETGFWLYFEALRLRRGVKAPVLQAELR